MGEESIPITFFGTRKEGWLHKQSTSTLSRWNKRYFVLNDNCLYYFVDEKVSTVRCMPRS